MSVIDTPLPIATRYTRSIHILHDFSNDQVGVHDYQATPLVIQTVSRVLEGLSPHATARAFSIIGPYGAGKSAFAIFLAHYLQAPQTLRRQLLEKHATDGIPSTLSYDAPSLLSLKISGNNESLRYSILRGLLDLFEATSFLDDKRLKLPRSIAAALDEDVSPQQVAQFLSETSALVKERSAFQGIAIIIDELGQFLYYASRQGDEQDLFVLQTIAEMAARSGTTPIIIVTILHQAFERYASTSGIARRAEWAKVQGRFAELPFQEPPVQILRIVARALCPDPTRDPYAAVRQAWAEEFTPLTESLGLRPPEITLDDWKILLARTYPLHPTVLVALPPLFRQLAQNERSLFAFLTAPEPHSVPDVVQSSADTSTEMPIYRLTHLYNYVHTNLGASLFGRARAQRWAELAEALAQVGDTSLVTSDVLTIIGTLGALGQTYGLRASREQITFALRDRSDHPAIDAELDGLSKRKLVTYRQHRDSYIVWEGSDLDIDGLAQSARQVLGNTVSLVSLLQHHADTAPLLARRHSYVTGATRSFSVRYVDIAYLLSNPSVTPEDDGELLYVVPADDSELNAGYTWATDRTHHHENHRIIALPHRIRELRDLLLDVAALRQILNERPELESDRTARREVSSRLAEAQQLLAHTIAETYAPGRSRWFRLGHEVDVQTARQVDDLLSQACDETYHATPHIWNELIVRRQLSAATAKARRNLVEALLNHADKEILGIEGYPPERAIYESVLRQGTFHRLDSDGNWYIGEPTNDDPLHIKPTWDVMERFIAESDAEPRPLVDLFKRIEQPPYGVKLGLAPLLFALLYATHAGEIVIYERGSFAPIIDTALFERLLARPDVFSIRLSHAKGSRFAIYERLARTLAPQALNQRVQPALVAASLPLFRLFRSLPDFSKATKRISKPSQAIRAALREARAPDELLFEKLPIACGFAPFMADEVLNEMRVDMFFSALRTGLEELQQAYPQLLTHIRECIHQAFETSTVETNALRAELSERYTLIATSTGDTLIRALGVRLETADHGNAWVHSVATLVAKRPPDTWTDHDIATFESAINDLGRRFRVTEQVAVAAQTISPEARVLRVGVASGQGEHSRVVRVSNPKDPKMAQLHNELRDVLARYGTLTKEQQTAVLAELLDPLLTENIAVDLIPKDATSHD
ncbi:hypothetical protein [Herpetosiphon llansteffanensis]|uniref:hypothetical protein n=1 Tax=Herpetosiphon llansteffanensis TaxID=2094568 RepID=UPI000D7C34A9|nr:hypothetical protein [Herpetosiphon llansteffanensis]